MQLSYDLIKCLARLLDSLQTGRKMWISQSSFKVVSKCVQYQHIKCSHNDGVLDSLKPYDRGFVKLTLIS